MVTPLKRLRVNDELWDAFGDACTAVGTDRSKALVGFMRRVVTAMDAGQLVRSADPAPGPDAPE